MYETIYYDVVEYGDVLHSRKKRKKEDCIFQENIGLHVFLFTITRRLSMQ